MASSASLRAVRAVTLVLAMVGCGDDGGAEDSGGSGDAGGGTDGAATDGGATDGGGDIDGGPGDAGDGDSGSGLDGAMPADAGSDAGTMTLPLGMVRDATPHACSGAGVQPGATCTQMTITCPGVSDIGAQIAVAEPTGARTGTVFMIYGGGGMGWFDEGFPLLYRARGLRVVQARFQSAWEESPAGSVKLAACRPATLFRYVFDEVVGGSRDEGFCGHGHSGGSGAMGYAMAHYGAESFADYVFFDAGPVFGRIDEGCEPTGGVTTRRVCDELPAGTFVYGGASALLNDWTDSTRCGTPYGDASAEQVAAWRDDSVVSDGADFDWPDTEAAFWYCANMANEAAGQGSFVHEQVPTATVNCVTGMCRVEPPWSDPAAKLAMADDMAAGCIPRHL